MPTNLDLYISNLDVCNNDIDVASIIGTSYAAITGTDSNLYYQAPLANWQRIFKLYTDEDGDVRLLTAVAKDFISDGTDAANYSVDSLYDVCGNTYTDVSNNPYNTSKINDLSAVLGSTVDPASALDFIQELAKAVTGSPQSVNLLSNEGTLFTDYGNQIEAAARTISTNFATAGTATKNSSISGSSSVKLQVAQKIYQNIGQIDAKRYTLAYQATTAAGTPVDTSGAIVTATSPSSGTGATVNVSMSGTIIDNIAINTTGSNYAKGDAITITTTTGNTIGITSLTDFQASILNGTLTTSSGTEFPLIAGDVFHIGVSIQNNSDQDNIGGYNLDTIGDTVTRKVNLHIKLA